MTSELQEKFAAGKWYYMQTFKKDSYRHKVVIVFADSKKEAEEKGKAWALDQGQDGEVFYYKNNYKREAKQMIAAGRYI